MKCPKCNFENPTGTRFCANCGTQVPVWAEIPLAETETIAELPKMLTRGSLFAERYEIIEELGKGGMGKVYRAFDKKIDEEVALKLLRTEIASDLQTITRFKNELKFARKIVHKNVCRMYDLNEYRGTHFITMEYVAGEDLKTLIRRIGQLTAGKAIFIAKQICEGLAEAHKLDVVHRDLKSQNIMIDRNGNTHVMDFGIARSLHTEGVTTAGVIVGTPHYMSPEQVEGKEVDQRSDIYALGIILFEMLTGRLPFEGDTALIVAVKHKMEPPPDPRKFNPHLSEGLSQVILKCMEKNKNKRYQTVEEVVNELERIKRELPTTDRIIPGVKAETGAKRKLAVPIILIIAAVLLVGGYFFYEKFLHKEAVMKEAKPAEIPAQTTPPAPIPVAPQSGHLEINSTPAGADIYINDKQEGTTPFKGELQPGTYNISLKKSPGYEERTDVLEIKAGESYSKDYVLVAQAIPKKPVAAQSANVEINSTPGGADVYLDGKQEGITPFKQKISLGSHRIRIDKSPEYKEISDVLNIKDDKPIVKNYNLTPVYILSLRTDPTAADVNLDGVYKGKTPIEIELSKSSCQLKIKKGEDWSSIDETLSLKPGINSVQRSLKKLGFNFFLKTDPPGASVYIENTLIGVSPLRQSDLNGTYSIRIQKEGYKTVTESITIKSDVDRTFNLQKLKLELVKIRLKASPYAEVYIDGKLIGEIPPIKTPEVEEGKHKIEFVSTPLNKKYTVELEIKAGESKEIRMNMETGEYKIENINLIS